MTVRMTDAPEKVEVITSVQRRRRWNAAEKMRMVEESLEPGASVELTRFRGHTELAADLGHRRAALRLPQGKGYLLIRITLPLHGTIPPWASKCPKNSRYSRTSSQGQDQPGEGQLRT
jgi:hypothetical protein